MVMMMKMKMMLTMMMVTRWWWWHGDDAMVMMPWWWHDEIMTWWHDDIMTWPRCSPNSNVNRNAIYNGHKGCVHCIFTLQHCKFTVLPDPLIVNLQCAGPQHCKLTVGTSCERDPKEMDFTVGIQWFYSGHTVYLKCVQLLIPLPL